MFFASIQGSGLYTRGVKEFYWAFHLRENEVWNLELASRILRCYNIDYHLISKIKLEELKNYLRTPGLKFNGRKKEILARVFAASENIVKPIKTDVEVEADLKTDYLAKVKIDDRNIPDPWPMVLYPNIFNYLIFFSSELGSKDLND